MAGQIAELSRRTLRRDFRHIDPTMSQITLLDAASQVLPSFGERLGEIAQRRLKKMGVDVQLGAKVVDIDSTGIEVEDMAGAQKGYRRRIEAVAKVWAAGVQASPLGAVLARQSAAEVDRAGRVKVNRDLTLPGHPEVFVVGDMIALDNLPGVAQVAIQGGKFAAKQIKRRLAGQATDAAFHYVDKGSMATVSRFSAVASVGRLRFGGFVAWMLWLVIHLFYLIGFKSRITTLLHWFISFLGRGRAERAITEQQVFAREAIERLGEAHQPHLP
jgi:NADH dehydrogenase